MHNTTRALPTLQLGFALPLRPAQLPLFAAAIATSAGWEHDLFHNHQPGEEQAAYHHRYPLIQYRVWRGEAQIWAVGPGIEPLKGWLAQVPPSLRIGRQSHSLRINRFVEGVYPLQMVSEPQHYRLMDYLPFNQDNYQLWREAPHLVARVELLERVLVGHVLGFCETMDFALPQRLDLRLTNLRETRTLKYRNQPRLGFNLSFRANISLPDQMGLGHHVSRGFGCVSHARRNA